MGEAGGDPAEADASEGEGLAGRDATLVMGGGGEDGADRKSVV